MCSAQESIERTAVVVRPAMYAYILTFLILVLTTALQGAWPTWLRIAAQPPDLIVAAVVCIGLRRGATEGCLAGLVAAVLYGAAAHVWMGGLVVAFMLIGAGAGSLRGTLLSERVEVAILAAAIAVIVAAFVRMVFVPPGAFLVWLKGTGAAAFYTALAAPAIFWITGLVEPREPDV